MEISGLVSALIVGAIIGGLGRLVLPGRQRVGWIMTIVIGVVAALLGSGVAAIFGLADTAGIDWIEIFLQVGLAAAGVAVASGAAAQKSITARR
jgi:uncharacterized membrane protein YeaQ/YmgE (transglycosylase-associated protein family)